MLMLQGGGIQQGVRKTLEATELSPPLHFENITVDNPTVIHRVKKFHRNLATLQRILCDVCLEWFPTFIINTTATEICHRDTQTPKMFSAENNMNPGPVPPELLLCYINVKIFLLDLYNSTSTRSPLLLIHTVDGC